MLSPLPVRLWAEPTAELTGSAGFRSAARFLRGAARQYALDEAGASLVEYGVALLVVVAVGAVAMGALGNAIRAQMTAACTILGGTC